MRVCGLCWTGDALLLVNHRGLTASDFWAPPGGGLEFGESAEASLQREFLEETGLIVKPLSFQFACEFVRPPLHAVELFFEVTPESGSLRAGYDPELPLITDVKYLTYTEWDSLPIDQRHGLFSLVRSAEELKRLRGFFRI